jgi:hypothetical protein
MKQKSVFLMFAVLLGLRITTTAQTPPAYVPADGLVGWWPFNGNANDESGNGNNGTVNGATLTEDRFGNGNVAYEFDGQSDFIQVPNSNSLMNMTNISISAWYEVSAWWYDFANDGWFPILSKTDSPNYGLYRLGVALDASTNEVGAYCTFSTDAASAIENNLFQTNTWNHVVYTIFNDSSVIYINGEVAFSGSTVPTGWPTTNTLPLIIGKDIPGYVDYANGRIDDIGIWNRALTQEEITDLYNANLCYEYITVTDTLIINLGPTGFNPVTYSNTILMYPNPSNDQLTVDYGDYATLAGYTLKIFNSIGQEIHSANINQQQEVLPLGTWGGAGNYQVVIYNAQGVPVDTRTIVLQ